MDRGRGPRPCCRDCLRAPPPTQPLLRPPQRGHHFSHETLPMELLEALGESRTCSISVGLPTCRPGWTITPAEAHVLTGLQAVRHRQPMASAATAHFAGANPLVAPRGVLLDLDSAQSAPPTRWLKPSAPSSRPAVWTSPLKWCRTRNSSRRVRPWLISRSP